MLTETITVAEMSGPLMVALHRVVSSLVRCYAGEQKQLDLPMPFAPQAAQISQMQPGEPEGGISSRGFQSQIDAGLSRISSWNCRLIDLCGWWSSSIFRLTQSPRKAYAEFRKRLLKDGFTMLQYSVYARHSSSQENLDVHAKRVEGWVPADGEVRLLTVTDKQFERMRIYWGKSANRPARSRNNSSFSDARASQSRSDCITYGGDESIQSRPESNPQLADNS